MMLVCAVLVVGEEAGQYGRGSLLVRVDQLGPLAITAAKKLTFPTGTADSPISSNVRNQL